MSKPDWPIMAKDACETKAGGLDYRKANAGIIRRAIDGIGIDSGRSHAAQGIRVVFNVSSAHIRPMLEHGYKNCYEIAAESALRIGDPSPPAVGVRRQQIDTVIARLVPRAQDPADLYYGAVELNGCGMRYYGDFCLVLKDEEFADETVILYRNSYDLDRSPIRDAIADGSTTLADQAAGLAGSRGVAGDMFICKILGERDADARLLTTGQVSGGVIDDEDYLEVPRRGSFEVGDLVEIRTDAGAVSAEARIADRQMRGPPPTLAEMIWRKRRREAERAANGAGLAVRVVTTGGRTR